MGTEFVILIAKEVPVMKKALCICLVIDMLLCLTGCGSVQKAEETKPDYLLAKAYGTIDRKIGSGVL